MLRYPVKLTPDEDTLLVTSRDFPELTTYGETKDEALYHAVDAFEVLIAGRISRREDIPPPSKGRTLVTLPALTSTKVELYWAMRSEKVTKAELARRMECHPTQVDRLLDLYHHSRFDRIEVAFGALGMKIEVSAVPA